MRAVVQDRFGPPDVLELRELDEPEAGDGEVLVRVRAASVNPADWYLMTGTPWLARPQMGLRRPRTGRLGVDLAGEVAAVGRDVTRFRPGDEVFGTGDGTLAERVAVAEATLAPKPARLSFEQAAAVPVAGLTALQGLRDKGRLQPGQRVLVNGASGGVGTFAVQLAKALGAEVTAVCSTRNVEAARSLGADRVVDYTREDFTRGDRRHDLLLDVAGSRPWPACRRALEPEGRLVMVGAPKGNRLLGPLGHIGSVRLASLRASQKVLFFISRSSGEDLTALAELLDAGTVTRVCDRCAEGRTNICSAAYAETGFTLPGALAGRLVVPAGLLHRLPADRPLEAAALLEPAACVASGLLEAGVPRPGSRVAVVGDGPLGLLALLLLGATTPAELVLVGARPARSAFGPRCGATRVMAAGDTGALAGLAGRLDAVVEATNSPAGPATALPLLRRGGSALLLGISGAGRPAIDPDTVTLNQLRLQGGFAASRNAWRWVVGLYADGILDPSPLVTHRFPLEKVEDAFAALTEPDGGAVKILVHP
jgi:NADPH:quinone reductase-like Zn-dependent oxidoreductase